MHWTHRHCAPFCISLFIAFSLFAAGCNRSKGVTGENGLDHWTLKLDARPDTVRVGVNDTIFVVVRYG